MCVGISSLNPFRTSSSFNRVTITIGFGNSSGMQKSGEIKLFLWVQNKRSENLQLHRFRFRFRWCLRPIFRRITNWSNASSENSTRRQQTHPAASLYLITKEFKVNREQAVHLNILGWSFMKRCKTKVSFYHEIKYQYVTCLCVFIYSAIRI